METVMNVESAETNLSGLLDLARKNEDVYIAKRGVKVAKIVSVEEKKKRKRKFDFVPGNIDLSKGFFDPISDEDLELWGLK